jgi:hypothetical protein
MPGGKPISSLGSRMTAYNLQSVDSLPEPPARRDARPPAPRDQEAFVTGGAYSLLFLLGALEALIGCFHYSHTVGSVPLAAAGLALLILITCLLGAAGMRSTAGAVVPALGWFVVSLVLTLPTAGGSVIITSTTAGEWYLYGGALCAAAGVVIALLRRARTVRPRYQRS